MRDLETEIGASIRVVIDPMTGAAALAGWQDDSRRGVSDVCAIQKLMVENSWEWQQALAQAEAVAGRQMDLNAVSAGIHSHDGGSTWNSGH
jgi:hypothetical protein